MSERIVCCICSSSLVTIPQTNDDFFDETQNPYNNCAVGMMLAGYPRFPTHCPRWPVATARAASGPLILRLGTASLSLRAGCRHPVPCHKRRDSIPARSGPRCTLQPIAVESAGRAVRRLGTTRQHDAPRSIEKRGTPEAPVHMQ